MGATRGYDPRMARLGIDIGGTSVKAALLEEEKPARTAQSKSYSKPTREELLNAIRQAVCDARSIDQVGLCVPGLFDESARQVVRSVNLPCLNGWPLDGMIDQVIGQSKARLTIVNDALAGAVDVTRRKNLTGRTLTIALGTGVGAAVLDEGVPLQVEGHSPGHFGQMDVSLDEHAPIGPDGGAGSLEGYIGVAALIRDHGSVTNFLQHATIRDPALRALARAIRIAHAIYRPNQIVLIGGVGIRLSRLLDELKLEIDKNLTCVAQSGWLLLAGEDDFHSARGAAMLAG